MRISRFFIVLTALAVAACSQISLLKPGTHEIGGTYTVQSAGTWNRIELGNHVSWTIDGPSLQTLVFYSNIGDGENIFRIEGSSDGPTAIYEKMPKFRTGMTAPEIGELLVATMAQIGDSGVTVVSLVPAKFGARDGFRQELRYQDKDGLKRRAIFLGVETGDKLHLILYAAPEVHYFERDRAQAEQIMRSVRFLPNASS